MFDTLSDTQREIVFNKTGKFVVRACPGSGKTYAVAARLVHRLETWAPAWQGIATMSFTNAAWQEIERQIEEYFHIRSPIQYPHFLGTVDSFINRFIFLPFGHLVMGCKSRPVLVGEPHGPWLGRYFSESFFDNISFDGNGEMYALNVRRMPKNWTSNQHILESKRKLVKSGYANQHDANYFAMRILREYPDVARALVARFPMCMIDEAQDTSEIQMEIIDSLISQGLTEIALIGDPDQAIFEWRDAKPQLLEEKYEEWKSNSLMLNENRRSSQRLCDCTCRLSSLDETSRAINEEVRDLEIAPVVEIFDEDRIPVTVSRFLERCRAMGIPVSPNTVAVLYRSKSFFNSVTGIKPFSHTGTVWDTDSPCTKGLAKGKYMCDHGDFRCGFRLIEKTLACHHLDVRYCSERTMMDLEQDMGLPVLRRQVFQLIEMLPQTDCAIGKWIEDANDRIAKGGGDISLGVSDSVKSLTFDQLFGPQNTDRLALDYRLGTIHSVKGETFEAVLILLKNKGIGKFYRTLLKDGSRTSESEELRIVYVGITRPRKLLVIAVPDEQNRAAWDRALLS